MLRWIRRKEAPRWQQALLLVAVSVMGLGVVYETFIGRPRSDRQVNDFEGVLARIGILEGARFDSESRMAKTEVATLTRCYSSDRGIDVIDAFYDQALRADGWVRDVGGEHEATSSQEEFTPRVYTKGRDVAVLRVTGHRTAQQWQYCLTLTHKY